MERKTPKLPKTPKARKMNRTGLSGSYGSLAKSSGMGMGNTKLRQQNRRGDTMRNNAASIKAQHSVSVGPTMKKINKKKK